MNRKQYEEDMNRRFLERMADADTIEVVRTVDSVGYVRWSAEAYYCGRGRKEHIGGLSNATYEAATKAAHEWANMPGSLCYSCPIS